MGIKSYLFTEQMRMTDGLMYLSNDLFYGGKLLNGSGTDSASRPFPRALKTFFYKREAISPEGPTSIYPVLLDVRGICFTESNNISLTTIITSPLDLVLSRYTLRRHNELQT